MTTDSTARNRSESTSGVVYAALAFAIWGLIPVYWKALDAVPALEITMHRVIWSFLFLVGLILVQRRRHEFLEVLINGRMLLTLLSTAIIVSVCFCWPCSIITNHFRLPRSGHLSRSGRHLLFIRRIRWSTIGGKDDELRVTGKKGIGQRA